MIQDAENNTHLRGVPRAKWLEFHDQVLAGIGGMNMYEVVGSDTEEVNRLEEFVTSLTNREWHREDGE
jgi:hypothetical protein